MQGSSSRTWALQKTLEILVPRQCSITSYKKGKFLVIRIVFLLSEALIIWTSALDWHSDPGWLHRSCQPAISTRLAAASSSCLQYAASWSRPPPPPLRRVRPQHPQRITRARRCRIRRWWASLETWRAREGWQQTAMEGESSSRHKRRTTLCLAPTTSMTSPSNAATGEDQVHNLVQLFHSNDIQWQCFTPSLSSWICW